MSCPHPSEPGLGKLTPVWAKLRTNRKPRCGHMFPPGGAGGRAGPLTLSLFPACVYFLVARWYLPWRMQQLAICSSSSRRDSSDRSVLSFATVIFSAISSVMVMFCSRQSCRASWYWEGTTDTEMGRYPPAHPPPPPRKPGPGSGVACDCLSRHQPSGMSRRKCGAQKNLVLVVGRKGKQKFSSIIFFKF